MKNIAYRPLMKLILILIIMFYLIFLYIDIYCSQYMDLSSNIKFISIILCFFLSILSSSNAFDLHKLKLLQIGLFLTVIADFFLLVLDRYYEFGIAIFSMVQSIYSIRYGSESTRNTIKKYSIIFGAIFITYFIVNAFVKIDLYIPIGLFYGICIIVNVYKAIIVYANKLYPRPNGVMVAVGMILFLLCDINVVIYNVIRSTFFHFNSLLYRISFVSMWFFYLPSQVLLSLSGYRFIQ